MFMKNADLSELISISEAAKIRGVTHGAIQDLIKRGKLSAVEIGGRRYLNKSEVVKFKPKSVGRPKKKG